MGDRLLAEGFDDANVNVQEMRKQLHKIDEEHKIDTTSTEPVQTEEELEKQLKAAKIKTELIIKVDEAL